MKPSLPSMQKALPRYYFFVLFFTFAVLLSFFYGYYVKNLSASEYQNLQNISESVVSNMEQEIEKMSTVSLNTIYSKDILPGIRNISIDDIYSDKSYKNIQSIYNSISAMIGPQQTVAQINLYHKNSFSIGSGFYTYHKKINMDSKSDFKKINDKNGNKVMSLQEPLSYFITPAPLPNQPYYISLSRLYFDNAHEVEGFVEILQKCETFFSHLDRLSSANKDIRILIINEDNQTVYPLTSEGENTASYFGGSALAAKVKNGEIIHIADENGSKNALCYNEIKPVGWKLFVMMPDSLITRSLILPTLFFLAVLLLVLILTLIICYLISGKILKPLNALKNTFEKIHLDDVAEHTVDFVDLPDGQFEEIQTLISSFRNMYTKMNVSISEMLKSKENEIRVKEIATQSMMKPHFLYNNLANISVMAEENMNQEIITLTENLCDYLRYTSTGSETRSSMEEEFLYTQKYLTCMNVRYRDRLTYTLSLDDSIKDIIIPKLMIQPIIENSLKYAFMRKPPWILSVRGYPDSGGEKWYIEIKDNGIGFTKDEITSLESTLAAIRDSEDITQLKIGGMGLQNVYLRLLLQYGAHASLTLSNNTEGGALITIGGSINDRNSHQ